MIGVDTLPDAARPTPATATAPARSPSPATASSSAPRARCSRSPGRWSRSTPSWPRRSTTSPPRSSRCIADGTEFNVAVQKVLEEIITDHGAVVFNGDGYTEDWQIEAEARGLPNLRTTLDALPELITDEAMELFSHYGVFNHREMHSRYEIALEQYALSIGVEARSTLEIANTVDPARRPALPDRAGHQPGQPQGHRRRVRHHHPRRGVGRHQGPAGRHRHPARRAGPRARRVDALEEAKHARDRATCRPCSPCGPPPTSSRPWWPTTCGRCATYQEMLFIL